MRSPFVKIFYRPEMSFLGDKNSYSNSPRKPKLFVERLKKDKDFDSKFIIEDKFEPFTEYDFKIVHTDKYVENFFDGVKPICESNGITWSKEFSETVKYTNSSLYHSIKESIENPRSLCCSPTSGFHHAKPDRGSGFCTFSGQVLASVKLYEEKGVRGCYFDLDGHFGNSIEDHRYSNPIVSKAIPLWANFNIESRGIRYLQLLDNKLKTFKREALKGNIDYVVWCHGADSHEEDDLGGQLNTQQWIQCTINFVRTVKEIEKKLGRPFPVSYALFGGYRNDNFEKVLDLHEEDTKQLLKLLL